MQLDVHHLVALGLLFVRSAEREVTTINLPSSSSVVSISNHHLTPVIPRYYDIELALLSVDGPVRRGVPCSPQGFL